MKRVVINFVLTCGLLLFAVACQKDNDVKVADTPTLVGKWVCKYNSSETYRLTFSKDNTFIMSITMPEISGSTSGTYTYNDSQKMITYTVKSSTLGTTSIASYENVKFNSAAQWQTTSKEGITLVWNKE